MEAVAVIEKTFSPSPFLPPFLGVPPARGEPRGDHDDQNGAAVEAPVGELFPPPFFLEDDATERVGAERAQEGAAAAEEAEEAEAPLEEIAAAGARFRGRATEAAALRTQALRKKRAPAAAASTARPTPIQAPMEIEGLLLAEAVLGCCCCFFWGGGNERGGESERERGEGGTSRRKKKVAGEKKGEKQKIPRHCPPALPSEQPKTPPAAVTVSVSEEATEMLKVGRPRAVSSAC